MRGIDCDYLWWIPLLDKECKRMLALKDRPRELTNKEAV